MVIRTVRKLGVSAILGILLLALIAAPIAAGGQGEAHAGDAETAHASEDDHDRIPHVEAVALDPGEALRVVATTNIIGDVVRNVVGEEAEITVLITEGQNPHGYTPTPRAVAAIERAHVVFVNGFGLEENLLDTVETAATGYVVPVSAGIEPIGGSGHDHDDDHHEDHDDDHTDDDDHHDDDHHDEHADDDHDHDHAAGDPHVWFDPNNVIVWTQNIAEVMGELLPDSSERFVRAADAYVEELRALDADIRSRVAELPEGRRKLVIDHASLDYFAQAYGFEVIGTVIPATTDQAEPSAQAISRLVDVIRSADVPAIFVGATASRGLQNLTAAVAEEVGREIRVGTLLTGSLTAAGGGGESYLSFMDYNVTQIVENLAD